MAEKTYSVSELAAQLDLPRTTINDWLKNFAPFLEFEMKGKRKEFSANALNVLKSISEWKNEGKSASVIQKMLEEKYGITAEIAPEEEEKNAAETETQDNSAENSGELMQIVHTDLELLLSNIEQLNTRRIRSTRIAAWSAVIVMFFILAGVGISAYFIYLNMLKLRQDNARAQQEYSENIQKLQAENADKLEKLETLRRSELEKFEELRKIELDKLSKDFDIRNKKFQEELARQKKELAEAFKELGKSVAEQREAEIAKLRENFAAAQKDALEKLIAKEKELAVIQTKINDMQKNSAELMAENKHLSDALEQGRKSLKELKKKLDEIVSPEPQEEKQ